MAHVLAIIVLTFFALTIYQDVYRHNNDRYPAVVNHGTALFFVLCYIAALYNLSGVR